MRGTCVMPSRRAIRAALVLFMGAVASARAADGPTLGPGRHSLKLEAAGKTWTYHAQVPGAARAGKALPVVVVLHGAGGSGTTYLDHAGWGARAEASGFLAIAPDGLPMRPDEPPNFLTNPRLWNSAQLRPGAPRARVDDLAFFDALLDDVARRWSIDPKRVYVTGHSNGAGMTFRLAAERSERLAAIAPVASHCWVRAPKPKRALPTLYIVGTADPLVPMKGGVSVTPWGRRVTPPVRTTLDQWAEALGCPRETRESAPKPGLKEVRYATGRDGATLTALFIEGQGHGWPGGQGLLPERLLGNNQETLNATDAIWEFFEPRAQSDEEGPRVPGDQGPKTAPDAPA